MKNRPIVLVLSVTFVAAAAIAAPPWDQWRVEAQESRVERYLGREAIVLRNGTAWLDGMPFADGIIEFDVAASPEQGFHGFAFRAVDDNDYEHFYLRPHQSSNPDATQYTPVFGGVSGWQIYTGPRFALPVAIAPERWVHVRAVIRERRLEVEIDGETLVFPELIRTPVSGRFGLTSGGVAPGRFANVVVRPGATQPPVDAAGAERPETPPGAIQRYRVSTPFAESRLDTLEPLSRGRWSDLEWGSVRRRSGRDRESGHAA